MPRSYEVTALVPTGRPSPSAPTVAPATVREQARVGQVSLGLVPEAPSLPALSLEPEWKVQQRLWGHAFHPMCSYLAMFPAGLAHAFIARYSRPGDVVLDPFSGRGTTPLQACAEGRVGVGVDLNPMAALLTTAKVDAPERADVSARLGQLHLRYLDARTDWQALAGAALAEPGRGGVAVPGAGTGGPARPLPAEVALAFHPRTLAELLFLRHELHALDGPAALADRRDRFIAGAVLGILHGRSQTYLSDLMPNSFSMAPRYVREFVARTGFRPAERDTFGCVDAKLRRLYRQGVPPVRGVALRGDARAAAAPVRAALRARALPDRARLVVTSPPYLRVVKYGYYNWLRLWFLGVDPAAVDAELDDAHRLPAYVDFLGQVLADLAGVLADDAVVALVIGDVALDRGRAFSGGIGLAETIWEQAAEPAGYHLAGLVVDDIAAHRKLTKIWGAEAGRATTTDRVLVISPTELGRRRALAGAGLPVDWTWPPASRMRLA
ncbi:MAG TPA: DNA methyltransferase [Candidatus Sulfotelmatobacter sp.]|nr:DNA methyltransferase [Candidatus Sulfotelmatobacter sp.]